MSHSPSGREEVEPRVQAFATYLKDRWPHITPQRSLTTIHFDERVHPEALVAHLRWTAEKTLPDFIAKQRYGEVRDELNVMRGALIGKGLVTIDEASAIDAPLKAHAVAA